MTSAPIARAAAGFAHDIDIETRNFQLSPLPAVVGTVMPIDDRTAHRPDDLPDEWALVALGIAVLKEHATSALLAEVTVLDEIAVEHARQRLTEAGLVHDEYWLSDSAAALLRRSSIGQRRQLHHRAAAALYHSAAEATVVAGHLVAARDVRHSWAPAVLRAAADGALALDQLKQAAVCLELAYRLSGDPYERAGLAALLVSIEWRVNPSSATRNFVRASVALRAGHLPPQYIPCLVRYQLWHGRIEGACAALERVVEDPATAADLAFQRRWIDYLYPELRPRRSGIASDSAADTPEHEASLLLVAMRSADTTVDTIALARQVLLGNRLSAATAESLVVALDALIYAGELAMADEWCETLLAEAAARHSPTWLAIFAGIRADVALRRGDRIRAGATATAALNHIPAVNLGATVARPIAAYIGACTQAGRYDEARSQLDRDVPLTLFDSTLVLPYLRARGHLRLAIGETDEAMMDFQLCGSLMLRWDIDLPGLVPWRNDIALAHLAAGDRERAKIYAAMHLDRVSRPARHPSAATSLRILASTTDDASTRTGLLRRADTIAAAGADRLELARVRADLARAHEHLGEFGPANTIRASALRLATECGAEPLRRSIIDSVTLGGAVPEPTAVRVPGDAGPVPAGDGAGGVGLLSVAERRVAEMAGGGSRNREIAESLGITISTVEQHLTRVYRKLKVHHRTELPFLLEVRC
ncbi:helix-turn-helix transcriptional regulator [Nocardia asteroides]|uniref:helix-turn-helix transcriptional regulator n=1 Tax=Nocardia asteroides TaxID=1824 RepID=UPI001E2C1482|nr:helix-turn-helix transcriptional regulator [Nocardia asteroides]UGT62755.1 LuxR C-terminal-related transcriptional regulator [Nocardia asteroides]